jgi:hypothetical protein
MQETAPPLIAPSSKRVASGTPDEVDLPPIGWFFVVIAAVDLLGQVILVNPSLDGWIYLALQGLTSVGTALLPAALLYGMPDAARTHRLLLAALGALAVFELAVTGVLVFVRLHGLAADEIDTINTVSLVIEALIAASYVFYGLGLGRLRGSPPSRNTRWILAVLVFGQAAVAAITVLPGPSDGTAQDALEWWFFVISIAGAAATGYAGWVAVTAWVDRVEPRRFWMVLALAALASFAAVVAADVVAQIGVRDLVDSGITEDAITLLAVASFTAIVATNYAFAQLLPAGQPAAAGPADPGNPADLAEPTDQVPTTTTTPTAS